MWSETRVCRDCAPQQRRPLPRTCPALVHVSCLALLSAAPAAAQCMVTIMGPISVEGSPATAQQFAGVSGIASDAAGGFYMSDSQANRIVRLFPNGTMRSAMGVNRNSGGSSGNGCPASSALLSGVSGLAADGAGGVFLADRSNNVVRRILANGTVTFVAGNGTASLSGDGGCVHFRRHESCIVPIRGSSRAGPPRSRASTHQAELRSSTAAKAACG